MEHDEEQRRRLQIQQMKRLREHDEEQQKRQRAEVTGLDRDVQAAFPGFDMYGTKEDGGASGTEEGEIAEDGGASGTEEGEIAEDGGASGTEEGENKDRMNVEDIWSDTEVESDGAETEVESDGAYMAVESDGADTEGGIAHAVQSQS